MKRVASLYLPDWPIDRLRRQERPLAPPPDAGVADLVALKVTGDAERGQQCDAPRNTGWRPGARWARMDDVRHKMEMQIAALPAHQRPPMRELGRRSEAFEHPFKAMPPDEGGAMSSATSLTPPRRRPGLSCKGGGDEAQRSCSDGPQLGPGLRRGGVSELADRMAIHTDALMRRPDDYSSISDFPPGVTPAPPTPSAASLRTGLSRGPAAFLSAARSGTPAQGRGDGGQHSPISPGHHDGIAVDETERATTALARWQAMPAIRYPGDGPHPDKHARRGSNDPHSAPPGVAAFFDTGRTTAGTLARVVTEARPSAAPSAPQDSAAPLVTVHKIGSRVAIAAVSPAAQALGLERGMALTQARACVPGLDVRDADPGGDAAALERFALLLARRWMPMVAIDGVDGLLLDLSGVAHLHGGEARLARRLVRLLARHGVTARVGVADTAGAAWALARFGAADRPVVICSPGAHSAALDPLPVAALRLDERALSLLARLGIDTIGQLHAMPRAPLGQRFGAGVHNLIM